MNIKTLLLGILIFPAQWLFGQSIKGKVQEGKQRIPLPGVAIQEKGTPNGVIADERILSEQESTDRHEYCHYLVDNDYDHFCIKYKELKGN